MKKHISYPKIQQFRNVVTDLNHHISFTGLDNDGNAIYDHSIEKPTVTFKGTVKLHGTNASVCFNVENGFWSQSRSNIITPEKDNAGFAFFAETHKEAFMHLIETVMDEDDNIDESCTVSIYGEWAGKGIQKGVGISELDKAFYLLGAKISKLGHEDHVSYWVDSSSLRSDEDRIYNIEDFGTYSVDVDFNTPQLSQNKFTEITEAVEKECPVAKILGIEGGLGEGVVWTAEYKNNSYKFKVKGEKHSVTKVKTLASVDVEKLNSIQEFVSYAVTKNRFDQAIENTFGKDELDIRKMGDLIRWMVGDITSEELDTMAKNNLEPKDVNKYIAQRAKEMFFAAQKQY